MTYHRRGVAVRPRHGSGGVHIKLSRSRMFNFINQKYIENSSINTLHISHLYEILCWTKDDLTYDYVH